jgi:hypothetical protein
VTVTGAADIVRLRLSLSLWSVPNLSNGPGPSSPGLFAFCPPLHLSCSGARFGTVNLDDPSTSFTDTLSTAPEVEAYTGDDAGRAGLVQPLSSFTDSRPTEPVAIFRPDAFLPVRARVRPRGRASRPSCNGRVRGSRRGRSATRPQARSPGSSDDPHLDEPPGERRPLVGGRL